MSEKYISWYFLGDNWFVLQWIEMLEFGRSSFLLINLCIV